MDAPLITRDPSANTTDVYAFVNIENGKKYLVVALGVYPHEEPGIGPNAYNFDDNVLYEIHVATGRDLKAGKPTISYQFEFDDHVSGTRTRFWFPTWTLSTRRRRHARRTSFRPTRSPRSIGTPRPYSARESFRRTIRVTLRPSTIRVTTAKIRPRMVWRRRSNSTDTPIRPLRH